MSAPVKKTNKIKQRTSTTTIFVKMLSTDLVPVHNDIWRKLPFSSRRDFKPSREPVLWRRRKGHTGHDLNTDPEVFLCLPASSLELINLRCSPTHRLHFIGPALWTGIWACLENWSGIKVLEAWTAVSSETLHCISCTKKARPTQKFSFIWPPAPDKTGGHLSAVDLQTPHSETEDFCPPNMTKSKYRTSFVDATKCSNAYRTMGAVVVKVCI